MHRDRISCDGGGCLQQALRNAGGSPAQIDSICLEHGFQLPPQARDSQDLVLLRRLDPLPVVRHEAPQRAPQMTKVNSERWLLRDNTRIMTLELDNQILADIVWHEADCPDGDVWTLRVGDDVAGSVLRSRVQTATCPRSILREYSLNACVRAAETQHTTLDPGKNLYWLGFGPRPEALCARHCSQPRSRAAICLDMSEPRGAFVTQMALNSGAVLGDP